MSNATPTKKPVVTISRSNGMTCSRGYAAKVIWAARIAARLGGCETAPYVYYNFGVKLIWTPWTEFHHLN